MILLDTGALIDFLSNGRGADEVELLISREEAVISAISAYELLRGVRSAAHIAERDELISLLKMIPLDGIIAGRAAALYTTLRSNGITIDNEDIIAAATALHLSLPVLTPNIRHFQSIPNLQLMQYPEQ